MVIWAIGIAALVASAVQLFAYRQAALGRDTLHRVQARWAARGGLENTIAILALHTEQPIPDDAFALISDLEIVAADQFFETSYDIVYDSDGNSWAGPFDEHSKLNLNGADMNALELLEDMTPDVAAAIRDWMDSDDDPGMLGAETDYYLGMTTPYEPRNGAFRNIAELELVAGIWGDYVRGEDWNLNNRKDRNEDDGDQSLPEDQPDGFLDAGWSARLTVHSIDLEPTASGFPRLYLRWAEPTEVMGRCGVDYEQAEALITFGKNEQNSLTQLIGGGLTGGTAGGSRGAPGGGGGGTGGAGGDAGETPTGPLPLTDEQLRAVLAETTTRPLFDRRPGKINLNTASPELLRDFLEILRIDQVIADEIIYARDSQSEGLTSILNLSELIPDVSPPMLRQLADLFTTTSSVYSVSVRGRSEISGKEVEIIAVVDRSSIPVRILEYREQ